MMVVVASRNPVKIEAAKQAFASQFPSSDIEISCVNVESGVSHQPYGDHETRKGARNRAEEAQRVYPLADFCVGLEGGIESIGDQLMAFAWMVVRGSNGKTGEARSATLPLPPAVKKLVEGGLELGEANDRVFSTANSKQAGGAYGLLTDGRYTREFIYSQTLILALIPFVNELYPHSHPD